MHHKFAIIDNKVIMFGSFNWTVQAQKRNRENLHNTSDQDIIFPFSQEFESLWNEYVNTKPLSPRK